jgi:hypothetical protein
MKIGGTRTSNLDQYLLHTDGEFRGSCAHCLTDYQLEQDIVGKKATLTTFHCLGRCKSPDDWIWQSFTKSMKYGTVMPTGVISAPCARESWQSEALVFRRFEVKRKEISPCAVLY